MALSQRLGLEFPNRELFGVGLLSVEGVSGGVQDLEGIAVAAISLIALRLEIPHEHTLILRYHILLLLQQV